MTKQHPITPPPELVSLWEDYLSDVPTNSIMTITSSRLQDITTQAARWGADQELEACVEWLRNAPFGLALNTGGNQLRAARRPKPPSLKEVALQILGTIERDAHYLPEITDTIRRALEQLDD